MKAARIAAAVVVVGVTGSFLAACAPRFRDHSVLEATATGRLVTLRWTAAQADRDKRVTAHGIEVNGTEVARARIDDVVCALGAEWGV